MVDLIKTLLNKLRQIPPGIFLVLFILSAVIAISALRHNNQTMIKLRQAVYQADKNGNDVNKPLNDLRRYVYSHMNTDLASGGNAIKPPIQLKYTYERLQAVEEERVKAVNSKIYTDAQTYCQQQNPTDFSGRNRVPCVTQYVTTHGVKAKTIAASLYQFDFISPSWSPDLAGWTVIATVVFLVAFLLSFVNQKLIHRRLKSF